MKFLRILLLATVSVFGLGSPVPAQAPEPAKVEYNLASCGRRLFGAFHIEIVGDKLTFTWHLAGPGEIEKESPEDLVVMKYTAKPADEDGVVKFHAEADIDGKIVEFNGMQKGKYMIAVSVSNGDLYSAFYGSLGSVDELGPAHPGPQDDPDFGFCTDLRGHDENEVVPELVQWLVKQTKGGDKGGSSASR